MRSLLAIVGVIGAVVVGVLVLGLLLSLPVMWLWNGILPELFGFKEISWLQAWGLLILCGFLFRSSSTSSSK